MSFQPDSFTSAACSTTRCADRNPFLSMVDTDVESLGLEVGTELDRFCIRHLIGKGSLGEVYLAYDRVNECDVALKIARANIPTLTELSSSLKHEKEMYDNVRDYRYVIKVHEIYSLNLGSIPLMLLSMEYANGGTLRRWLTSHRSDWEFRRNQGRVYFRQLCKGIAALHEAGVSHLDPKPDNFLFVNDVIKVGDLGGAILLNRGRTEAKAWENDTSMGTPVYMSPEHFTGSYSDLDIRSDIYSLGVVLYEILSRHGKPPFHGDYDRLRVLHTGITPPVLEGISDQYRMTVKRCLEKEPERRFQTIEELLDALDEDGDETPDEEKQDVDGLWDDICSALEQNMPEDARRYCRRLLEACPDHADALEVLAQLDRRYEQAGRIYSGIEAGMSCRCIDELVELLNTAVELFPNHPASHTSLIQLEIKTRQYRAAMEEGLIALKRGNWLDGKTMFEKARLCNPGAIEVERAIRFSSAVMEKQQETRQFIDQAIAVEAFDRALELAEALDTYLDERKTEVQSLVEGEI